MTMTSLSALRSFASERMSSPEPSGIIRSVSTTPYGVGAFMIASRALTKPGARVTSYFSRRKRMASISRRPGSSSATRMLARSVMMRRSPHAVAHLDEVRLRSARSVSQLRRDRLGFAGGDRDGHRLLQRLFGVDEEHGVRAR